MPERARKRARQLPGGLLEVRRDFASLDRLIDKTEEPGLEGFYRLQATTNHGQSLSSRLMSGPG